MPRPMLATLVDAPFYRPGWAYEEKYDGNRALAHRHGGKVELLSRNLNDISDSFSEIVRAVARLPGGDLVLDGEIVALDAKGVSPFQLLQRRAIAKEVRPRYAIFDCLERGGESLVGRPLAERRAALEGVVRRDDSVLFRSRRLAADGRARWRAGQRSRCPGAAGSRNR